MLELPAVKERLDRAERETRDQYAARHRAELESLAQEKAGLADEIAQQRRELEEITQQVKIAKVNGFAEVRRQLDERRAELQDLERQIANRKSSLANQVDDFDVELRARLSDIAALPHRALAEVAIMRAMLHGSESQPMPAAPPATCARPPLPDHLTRSADEQITEPTTLKSRLQNALRGRQIGGQLAQPIGATLLAGGMSLVVGDGALDALEACASQIAGGRMLWLPVPPTAIEPADLLGRANPQTQRFAPHPGGLLDLLLHAAQPENADRLYLVVLDGVNRAAADAYLLPLLACYLRAVGGQPGRLIPVLHPAAVLPHDPYLDVPHLIWPANVLLAGTLAEGATTVPLPRSIWSYAALCHAKMTIPQNGKRSRVTVGEVSAARWRGWQQESAGREASFSTGTPSELLNIDGFHGGDGSAQLSRRLAAAVCSLGVDEREAIQIGVRGCLVPYAVVAGRTSGDHRPLVDAAGMQEDDLKAIREVLT